MPDDKSNHGSQDRARVAAEQPYEVAYFAKKHGIPAAQAQKIIEDFGPSRAACDKAAQQT